VNVAAKTGDPSTGPELSHGTHVAGIIAAEDNGQGITGVAAGKVKLMAVAGQFTPSTELQAFEKSVDYLVAMKAKGHNIRVVNGSFGDKYDDPSVQQRFTAACQKLADAGIIVVFAAGNEMANNDRANFFPANVNLPNVVSVAAMDSANNRLAYFSNYGVRNVDLAAPGSSILSTVPGNRYQRMDGTSMASPHVAGAVGRLCAAFPNATPAEIIQKLMDSLEKDPDLNGKVVTGGKLNVANLP
jgi:subtilisin family serine protease